MNAVKIEQMEYVVEIARTGSISEAAGRFFLSQSTLSQSIKALEEELGTDIFIRNNRGVALTDFGKEFVSYSKSILSQINQIRSRSAGCRRVIPHLSVASAGYRFMVRACAKLTERYRDTGIEISIRDDPTHEALDHISANTCEISAYSVLSCYRSATKKQLQAKSLAFFPLMHVPMSIMVGRGNPLFYSERKSVSRKELEPFPLAISANTQDGLKNSLINELRLPTPRSKFITTTFSARYTLLDISDAYFFGATPRALQQEDDGYPQIRALILEDCDVTAEIGWLKNEKDPLSPLATEYVEILRDFFPEP